MADAKANEVRLDWIRRSRELPVWLWGEDAHRLVVDGSQVVGNVYRAILRRQEALRMRKWAGGPSPERRALAHAGVGGGRDPPATPGPDLLGGTPETPLAGEGATLVPLDGCPSHTRRLAWGSRYALLSMCRVVHRLRSAKARLFFAMVVTEYLPTERRLTVKGAGGGRGDCCKLCGRYRDSVRHVYVCDCPALRAYRRSLVRRCVRILKKSGVQVAHSAYRPGPAVTDGDGDVVWVPVWFDVEDRHWMRVWAPHGQGSGLGVRDRFGDVVGLIPDGLQALLDRTCSRGKWCRRKLGATQELLGAVRLELLLAAQRIWDRRCALMDEWFGSPAAHDYRRARILELAEGRQKRSVKAQERGMRKYMAKRAAAGSAPAGGADAVVSIAHRLARVRTQTKHDPFLVLDETQTVAEFVAEVEHDLTRPTCGGGSRALPHY